MANPKSAKNPNVGMTPTAGSVGVATVMMAATMIPTTAPVIMNDQIRGARRMVTSVFGIVLFSQSRQGREFGERRAGSRCPDSSAIDGRVPRFGTDRERHERVCIQLDDIGRGSSRVSESLNNLDRAVRRHAHFHGFARRDAREFLQDEPHGDGGRFAVCGPVSNCGDGGSAALGIDSGKGHAQHASSGEGSVFT